MMHVFDLLTLCQKVGLKQGQSGDIRMLALVMALQRNETGVF